MKKIVISAVLLTVGYGVNAQVKSNWKTEPEINNSNAFLDASSNFSIQANDNKIGKGLVFPDTDLTTFEFDLTLADGQTFPTWFNGMVVYNIGTGPTGANVNKQGQVVNVTPGFYYFSNPTGGDSNSVATGKWVRIGGDASNNGFWQKQTNKDILLSDSDIENTVKYTEKGGFVNTPKTVRNINKGSIVEGIVEVSVQQGNNDTIENSGILNIKYVDKIPLKNGSNSRSIATNYLLVDEHNNNSNNTHIGGLRNIVHLNKNASKEYGLLYGNLNMVQYFSPVKSNWTVGGWNLNEVSNGDVTTVTGALNQNSIGTTGQNISLVEGTRSLNTIAGRAKIKDVVSTRNMFYMLSTSSDKITNAVGTKNDFYVLKDNSGSIPNSTITNMIGSLTTFSIPTEYNKITNQYGLKIENVNKGTAINRAIHTDAGQIRFGDLVSTNANNAAATADKPVYVTADGVLKVGTARASEVASTTNMECNDQNRGKMNFIKDVPVNGGTADVFGVCMKNSDGNYYWGYMMGGAHTTTGRGNFGSSL